MPDPADIIAKTISDPPREDDYCCTDGFEWQYWLMMGNPAAPDFARRIAAAVVEALTGAGWKLLPPPVRLPSLPSPPQICAWLTAHEWRQGDHPGHAGALWYPPVSGRGVGVPHDSDDEILISGAVERIAGRMGMSPGQVAAEMMGYADE